MSSITNLSLVNVPQVLEIDSKGECATLLIDGQIKKVYASCAECRAIYEYGGLIVKVDVNPYFIQSGAEYNFWLKIEPEDRKYFAEIVYHSYRVNIQKFYELKFCYESPKGWSEAWQKVKELDAKYNLEDIHYHKNWGILENGEPIIFDYRDETCDDRPGCTCTYCEEALTMLG